MTDKLPPSMRYGNYAAFKIEFRGKTPDQFTEQDEIDFIEETYKQLEEMKDRMWLQMISNVCQFPTDEATYQAPKLAKSLIAKIEAENK